MNDYASDAYSLTGIGIDRTRPTNNQVLAYNSVTNFYQPATVSGVAGAPDNATYVTLSTSSSLSQERVLTGTANQIIITDGGANGNVTLSLPQNINTGAQPTFAGAILTTGDTLIANSLTAPTGKSNGFIGVYEISADGRIYWFVNGNRYRVSGTLDNPGGTTGSPMGLLMALTYA